MKKLLILVIVTFIYNALFAQNVGIGTTAPNANFHVAENNTVLFGADTLGGGNKLMWIPSRGVFRAGILVGPGVNNWNQDSLGIGSFAAGLNSSARGNYSTVFGFACKASGESSFAAGNQTKATGFYANAFGSETQALENLAMVWGLQTIATGTAATAWGVSNTASGDQSTVWGDGNTTSGEYATSWGVNTSATNLATTSWGVATFATGDFSTAWGEGALATGISSTAWGSAAEASGTYASAWGQSSTASGRSSTAWGMGATASGRISTAMGFSTNAEAYLTTALGQNNIGGGNPIQWINDDPIFEIGIGDVISSKNALTVLKNGKHGIVTNEPKANLHVKDDGTINQPTTVLILESTTSMRPLLQFSENPAGTPGSGMSIEYDGRESGPDNKLYIKKAGGDPMVTFGNSGLVGIGITDPSFALHLPDDLVTGRARAKSWSTYSDRRIKSNLSTLSYGLKEILLLKPMNYNQHSALFNNSELTIDPASAPTIGFIAQEVHKIIPEAVEQPTNEQEQLWGMDYNKLIPVLVKGMQEQQQEIEALKVQIKQLTNANNLTAEH